MIKFNINIQDLQKQIDQKKREILQGVNDGFRDLAPILEGRMKFYMDDIVYSYISGSNSDEKYERTFDLLNSIRSEVVNNALYIWSGQGLDYAERVLVGNDVIPYDYPWLPAGSTGDFREARNWIEPTKMEIINHFHAGGQLIGIMINAIKRRI